MTYRPTGYTFDADIWCPACAHQYLGPDEDERDDVGVLFPDSESDYPQTCCKCQAFIPGSLTPDGQAYALENFAAGGTGLIAELRAEVRAYFDWLPWPETTGAKS